MKRSPKDWQGGRIAGWPPGTYLAEDIPVRALIEDAYDVKAFQVVGGPEWISTDGYHITAKWRLDAAAGPVTGRTLAEAAAESSRMLRTLLEDRFKLKLHRDTREMPTYVISPVRGGAKLTSSTPGSCVPVGQKPGEGQKPTAVCGSSRTLREGANMVFEGAGLGMESVVRWLSNMTKRTIVDQTGLTGRYDIRVQWVPQTLGPASAAGAGDAPQVAPAELSGPTVYVALREQLGLRLDDGRAPIEVLVIDAIERPTPD